ncbi:zeta toxin family protein [Lacticaseibacillus manihotivorans]|jgi:predicted ABC-type ATPase|nr:zeta toxin family protein [Lacticaseibacillus manihotivorans]QFQ91980.1 AAA family ATPase [Lacticaseibacillus manihotivorans]
MDDESVQYAKAHRKEFLNRVIDSIEPNQEPKSAIFMAGIPGAGKSEVARGFQTMITNVARVDADQFREYFPGYHGDNAKDFQRGSSLLVDFVYNKLIDRKYSVILDATFGFNKALDNVERAVRHGYVVTICYVCQDPVVAWHFIQGRARAEGRVVPAEAFINTYYQSRQNFLAAVAKYGEQIDAMIVYKTFDNNIADFSDSVQNPELVLPPLYSLEELKGAIL